MFVTPAHRPSPAFFGQTNGFQDKSRVEIIVVDAGCKDHTMAAVASVKLGVKLRCACIFIDYVSYT